jgi:tetratricopeptide (TPR) repeat protein
VRRSALALAAMSMALHAGAQDRPQPDPPLSEWAPDVVASLPGLERDAARAVSAALRARAYDEAEKVLVEAAQRPGTTPELLRLLGGVSFLGGHYLNAAIALKKAEAMAPLDERSRFTLAMSYVVLGQRAWARPELRKLAEAAPGNALYPYWTARLDYDASQYADAVAGFLKSLALDPRFVKALDNLGLSYDALGRYDEAEASYDRAVRLNRESGVPSPWPPHNLGLLLTRLNRPAEAEPLFREAVRHDAGFAPAHYQLGLILEKTGRADEAIVELQEAARLDPGYPDPQYALARLFRRLGRAAEADGALEIFRRLKNEQRKAAPAPMR